MKRHDLTFVSPRGWRTILAVRGDLAAEPLVASWADNGWPLVARRPLPGEGQGVALGLPLPPFAGRRRLSFLLPPEEIVAVGSPLSLNACRTAAPRSWGPTLDRLHVLAERHAVEARVFGSLAWAALTGLDYLADRSDVDLLLPLQPHTDLFSLADGMAAIDATAPMRLDGEFVRPDGVAVNWREVREGSPQILVKSMAGVGLLDMAHFLDGRTPP
jgi:phosphoribosyl-dephospho-CoA transferase